MLKNKLTSAILLAGLTISSAHAFEFHFQQALGEDMAGQNDGGFSELLPLLVKSSMADLDNDGDLDIWFMLNEIWLNDGQGKFIKSDKGPDVEKDGFFIKLTDIDNDGDIDVAVNREVYLNDGQANYTLGAPLLDQDNEEKESLLILDLVDLDNDEKLDVVTLTVRDTIGVFLNQGNNKYSKIINNDLTLSDDFAIFAKVGTFADVDNDGDLDVWLPSTKDTTPMLLFNDGQGHFTESAQKDFFISLATSNGVTIATTKIAVGDIDNDGDIDAWVTSALSLEEGAPAHVLINDGKGVFTELAQNFDVILSTTDAQLSDVDNDGDLDALEVSLSTTVPAQGDFREMVLTIWLNDGTGHFTNSHKDNIKGFFGTKINMGDFNKDGIQDMIVGDQIWFGGVDPENSGLCDWAEKRFPQFFPKRAPDLVSGNWEYRYYPSVKTYIGVETVQDKIFVLGDVFNGLIEVGNKKEMLELSKKP